MPRHNLPGRAPMSRHNCPADAQRPGTEALPAKAANAQRPGTLALPPPPTHARAPHPRRCPASKHVGIASRPCQGTTRQNNAFLENLDGQTAFGSLEMARSRKNDQIKKKFVENGQPSAKLRQFKVSLSATRFFTIQVNKG